MTIYTPYFYIIQDVRNDMYYAGAKWAQDANPTNFMVEDGYMTSSETIEELIRQYGLNNFIIRKIRTFETGQEAYRYETKFLQKVNARSNPRFYNCHNNDGTMDPDKMKFIMMELYGVENPMHSEQIKSRMKNNNLKKYEVENIFQAKWVKEKIKETNIKNLGVPYPMMSEKCKEKAKKTNMKNLGVENAMYSEYIKNMQKQNNIEKYGVENVYQTNFVKEKSKKTLLEKYGVENAMQSEEIKKRMIQTNLEKYGVENTFQSEIAKEKITKRREYLLNRIELDVIRKYKKKYKLKFGQGWVRKSDEFIGELLNNLIKTYGEI